MFVLPLGLENENKKLPWATLIICAATIVYSITHMEAIHRYEVELTNSKQRKELLTTRIQLILENCTTLGFSPHLCQSIKAASSHPDFNSSPSRVLDRSIGKNEKKISEDEVEMLANYLMTEGAWQSVAPEIKDTALHKQMLEREDAYLRQHQELTKSLGFLSRQNMSSWMIIRAQLLHGGWMHLIGNIVFFILLATAVEARLGVILFSLVYWGGGSIGIWAWTLFADKSDIVVGASASIFAIYGAFALLYWKKPIQLFVSYFFVINRRVSLPSYIYFPSLILLYEFAGVLGGRSGVAHDAHLFGFAGGAALAWGLKRLNPLPDGFISKDELTEFEQAKSHPDGKKRFRMLLTLIARNKTNHVIRDLLFKEARDLPNPQLKKEFDFYFGEIFSPHFNEVLNLKGSQREPVVNWIKSVPYHWDLNSIINALDSQSCTLLADELVKQSEYAHALRLYDLYLYKNPGADRAVGILKTVDNILNHLSMDLSDRANVDALKMYMDASETQTLVREKIQEKFGFKLQGDRHEA